MNVLKAEGYSQRDIALRLHISRCAVQNALHLVYGLNRKRCGRKRKTTPQEDRILKAVVTRSPHASLPQRTILVLKSGPHCLASWANRAEDAWRLRVTTAFNIQSSRGEVFRFLPHLFRFEPSTRRSAFWTAQLEMCRRREITRWEYPSAFKTLFCPLWNWFISRFLPILLQK